MRKIVVSDQWVELCGNGRSYRAVGGVKGKREDLYAKLTYTRGKVTKVVGGVVSSKKGLFCMARGRIAELVE